MKQLLKEFIKKRIVDYRILVLSYYHRLGLTEQEAVALIKLNALLEDKKEIIRPDKFSKLLSISTKETEELLASLMTKGYLKVKLITTENGKEKETFDIDYFLVKVIDIFEKEQQKTYESITQKWVTFLEDTLQKPLTPLDIELISKWIEEDQYPFEMIKEATFKALQRTNPSLRQIDKLLLQETKDSEAPPKKKEVLKEFYKLWEE